MAAGRYKPVVTTFIILILACQIWSGAAYNNQQSKWLTKHMISNHGTSRPVGHRADRHLQETTRATGKYGLRASLVNEDHKLHSRYNLSSMERVKHGAEKSRARAWSLESKARAATFYGTSGAGRKTLQVAEPPSYEAPVEATPGSYSMSISIGTPPQKFIAIADTGSDLVWIQCAACTECFQQSSPRFEPTNSSTYKNLGCSTECTALGSNEIQCTPQCTYSYQYGDQSNTAGDFAQDTVSLAIHNETTSILIPGFNFGCGLQNNGTFTDTDGIVGLARGPVSFPSQIAPYLNNATKFSYCLVDKQSESTVTSPIIFGEDAVPANLSAVLYTPVMTPYDVSMVPFYYVNLQGIAVGGTNLRIPASAFEVDANGNGGTIFDSGTTYTALTDDAYTAVENEYSALLMDYTPVNLFQETGLSLCYDITGLTAVKAPTLVFQFENADFDLPFDNFMVMMGDTAGNTYMCLALMGQTGMNIFGNTQQQNFQVLYEEDVLKIGWLPLDCTTL